MNKIFMNLILIAIMTVFGQPKASAVVLKNEQIIQSVQKETAKIYKNYTSADIDVTVLDLPFSSINVPEGKITYGIKRSSNNFLQRDLIKITIYVNGRAVKVFNAPIKVLAYENVLVASCPIDRESALNPTVVHSERKEISNNFAHVVKPTLLIGKELYAKKHFASGEIIDDRYIKLKPDILRNALVTVFFNSNDLTVSVEGKALSDGLVGDSMTVLSKQYNRVYKGTVIGENKVLVKI